MVGQAFNFSSPDPSSLSSVWGAGAPPPQPPPAAPAHPHLLHLSTPTHKDMEPLGEDDDASSLTGEDKEHGGDAEGVWSPDIEQSFQEALAIYPPCGRRKIILSDEGKMYGRNELIARYIKLRTGKTRTRKQVSSHIQVLARRKLREIQAKLKDVPGGCSTEDNNAMLRLVGTTHPSCNPYDQATKEKALQTMSSMSSAQIVSATTLHQKGGLGLGGGAYPPALSQFWNGGLQPGPSHDVKPFSGGHFMGEDSKGAVLGQGGLPPWEGRSIATSRLRLTEFTAFVEPRDSNENAYHRHIFVSIGGTPSHADPLCESIDVRQVQDKFPEGAGGFRELYEKGPENAFFLVKCWADLNTGQADDCQDYAVTSQYESFDNFAISVSTKVCSFGKQVVEKVETVYPAFEAGRFVYRIARSVMCEYMVNFIHKLKHLPEKRLMNSVLENFTILQVVSTKEGGETLVVVGFLFEVSSSEHGAQHHLYRLTQCD